MKYEVENIIWLRMKQEEIFFGLTCGPWIPSAVWMVRCSQEVQTRISDICNSLSMMYITCTYLRDAT